MRGKKLIAEGTTPTEITTETGWSKGIILNNSDSTLYLQWTHETDPLTTDNGFPLASGQSLSLDAVGLPAKGNLTRRAPVLALHATTGDKELRYTFE